MNVFLQANNLKGTEDMVNIFVINNFNYYVSERESLLLSINKGILRLCNQFKVILLFTEFCVLHNLTRSTHILH